MCDEVNDVAGAIYAEELKSVMTKLMMVPGAGEIEAVNAAVDHDDDQTVDYEEFEWKMMERTADVPHHCSKASAFAASHRAGCRVTISSASAQTVDVPVPQVMTQLSSSASDDPLMCLCPLPWSDRGESR